MALYDRELLAHLIGTLELQLPKRLEHLPTDIPEGAWTDLVYEGLADAFSAWKMFRLAIDGCEHRITLARSAKDAGATA